MLVYDDKCEHRKNLQGLSDNALQCIVRDLRHTKWMHLQARRKVAREILAERGVDE